jgi:hypothetical protein
VLGTKIDGTVGTSTKTEIIPIYYEIQHPQYNSINLSNDIMLLKLKYPSKQRPLQKLNFNVSFPQMDCDLIVIGHGSTVVGGPISTTLQQVTIQPIDYQYCKQFWFPYTTLRRYKVICAGNLKGGKDSCFW